MVQIKTYQKKDSFIKLKNKNKDHDIESLNLKILEILNNEKVNSLFNKAEIEIIKSLKKDFELKPQDINANSFKLRENTIAEINTFNSESEIIKYLINRYKYEIFPTQKKIDDYPPLIQIEPSSICNFRCVFCFETDTTFTDKKSGHMGTMKLELFKKIIDICNVIPSVIIRKIFCNFT